MAAPMASAAHDVLMSSDGSGEESSGPAAKRARGDRRTRVHDSGVGQRRTSQRKTAGRRQSVPKYVKKEDRVSYAIVREHRANELDKHGNVPLTDWGDSAERAKLVAAANAWKIAQTAASGSGAACEGAAVGADLSAAAVPSPGFKTSSVRSQQRGAQYAAQAALDAIAATKLSEGVRPAVMRQAANRLMKAAEKAEKATATAAGQQTRRHSSRRPAAEAASEPTPPSTTFVVLNNLGKGHKRAVINHILFTLTTVGVVRPHKHGHSFKHWARELTCDERTVALSYRWMQRFQPTFGRAPSLDEFLNRRNERDDKLPAHELESCTEWILDQCRPSPNPKDVLTLQRGDCETVHARHLAPEPFALVSGFTRVCCVGLAWIAYTHAGAVIFQMYRRWSLRPESRFARKSDLPGTAPRPMCFTKFMECIPWYVTVTGREECVCTTCLAAEQYGAKLIDLALPKLHKDCAVRCSLLCPKESDTGASWPPRPKTGRDLITLLLCEYEHSPETAPGHKWREACSRDECDKCSIANVLAVPEDSTNDDSNTIRFNALNIKAVMAADVVREEEEESPPEVQEPPATVVRVSARAPKAALKVRLNAEQEKKSWELTKRERLQRSRRALYEQVRQAMLAAEREIDGATDTEEAERRSAALRADLARLSYDMTTLMQLQEATETEVGKTAAKGVVGVSERGKAEAESGISRSAFKQGDIVAVMNLPEDSIFRPVCIYHQGVVQCRVHDNGLEDEWYAVSFAHEMVNSFNMVVNFKASELNYIKRSRTLVAHLAVPGAKTVMRDTHVFEERVSASNGDENGGGGAGAGAGAAAGAGGAGAAAGAVGGASAGDATTVMFTQASQGPATTAARDTARQFNRVRKEQEEEDGGNIPNTNWQEVRRVMTVKQFLEEFRWLMRCRYKPHIFLKRHQAYAEKKQLEMLERMHDHCVVKIDYAENFEMRGKQASQLQHFNPENLTMLVAVVYFWRINPDGSQGVGAESHTFFSDDKTKSAAFLGVCVSNLLQQVKLSFEKMWKTNGGLKLTHVHVWSDNAPHFHNASVFGVVEGLHLKVQDRGWGFADTTVMWNFTAPQHGKGAADGECGVLKHILKRAELAAGAGKRAFQNKDSVVMYLAEHAAQTMLVKKKHYSQPGFKWSVHNIRERKFYSVDAVDAPKRVQRATLTKLRVMEKYCFGTADMPSTGTVKTPQRADRWSAEEVCECRAPAHIDVTAPVQRPRRARASGASGGAGSSAIGDEEDKVAPEAPRAAPSGTPQERQFESLSKLVDSKQPPSCIVARRFSCWCELCMKSVRDKSRCKKSCPLQLDGASQLLLVQSLPWEWEVTKDPPVPKSKRKRGKSKAEG